MMMRKAKPGKSSLPPLESRSTRLPINRLTCAQLGTTDSGAQPEWCHRGRPQWVQHNVPILRQGQYRRAQSQQKTMTKTKITQRHWKKKKTTSYWHLKSPTCHFDIQILHSFPIWYSHFISIHVNCQIIITNTWISQTERGSWSTKISPTMIKKLTQDFNIEVLKHYFSIHLNFLSFCNLSFLGRMSSFLYYTTILKQKR